MSHFYEISSQFFSKFSFVLYLRDCCHAVLYYFSFDFLPFCGSYSSRNTNSTSTYSIVRWVNQWILWNLWNLRDHHQHPWCSKSKLTNDWTSFINWVVESCSLLKTNDKRLSSLKKTIHLFILQQWQYSVIYISK